MTDGKLTSKQEQLLAEVLTGARAVDDPEVVAERRDRHFADEVDSLLRAQNKLRDASALAEQDLADVRAEPEPFPGADALIRSTIAGQKQPDQSRRLVIGVAIAAALLASLLTWWWWPEGSVPRDQWLRGSIACISPKGEVRAFGEFAWRFELPPDGYFVVEVFDQRDLGTEITRSANLDAARWTPTVDLPSAIRWRVTAFDGFGNPLGFGWEEAKR